MHAYFLVIELPSSIKKRLSSLCYGLPNVQWVADDFHLTLRYLGSLSSKDLAELQERLNQLFFISFELTLKDVGHFHSKNDKGTIWLGVQSSFALMQLKKEIDALLQGLPLYFKKTSFIPHIVLGYYDQLNPDKLSDYLINHSYYQSGSFKIERCSLICTHQTPKRIFYETLHSYSASEPATGKD